MLYDPFDPDEREKEEKRREELARIPMGPPISSTIGGGLLLLGIAAVVAPRIVLPFVAIFCFLTVIGLALAYGIAGIVYAPFVCLGGACYALIKYKTLRYIVIVLALGFAFYRVFLCFHF
jgi:hypothetical protein